MTTTKTLGLSLDVWGTLLRSHPDFKPTRMEYLLAPGTLDPITFPATLKEVDQHADLLSMEDGVDRGGAWRLSRAMEAAQREPFEVTDEMVETILAAQSEMARAFPPNPLHPELPELVAAISEHIPVAITSNTGMLPGVLMRDLLAAAGYKADVWTFSNEVEGKGCKPFPAIFEATIKGLGVPAGNILHVGDNELADVIGGRAAGMMTAHVAPYSGEDTHRVLSDLLGRLA